MASVEIYDEARRGKWLDEQADDAPARKAFKKGEWNQYRVVCDGDRYRVRVLISYGEQWFPWYMRRLAERPANVLFVARSILSR